MNRDYEEYLRKAGLSLSTLSTPSNASASVEQLSRQLTSRKPECEPSASKRMRTSHGTAAAAGQSTISNEEKMEIIRWKGQVKILEARIVLLERDLEECHALTEKEKSQQKINKNALESRVLSLQRELSYVTDREQEAQQRISQLEKVLEQEHENSETMQRTWMEEKRGLEEEYFEQQDYLRSENQSNHSCYMDEQRQTTQLRHDCEQLGEELEVYKRQNAELGESVKSYEEQLGVLRENNTELQDEMKRFRDECALAMAMREDLKALKAVQQENAHLKKQVERFRNMSENTLLLKEKNMALEGRVGRLEKIQEHLATENNELKAAIVKASETMGHQQSFSDLDDLSRHCVDLKNENVILDQEVQRLNGRCEELEEMVTHKDGVINQMKAKTVRLRDEWKRAQSENVQLKKRVSYSVQNDECQTDGDATSFALADELREALREKDAKIEYLETRYGLKLDYDPKEVKIIHIEDNPLSLAQKEHADRIKAIEAENQKLRLCLQEMEQRQGNAGEGGQFSSEDVASKVTLRLNMEQLENEKRGLLDKVRRLEEEKQRQKERMTEAHQNLAREYREMCTLLTGYQLKMKEGGLYVVQSIYEKEKENYFLVQKGDGNEINLLQNEYTPRWMDFVETYLMTDHSIPAFLSAVTLSLYEKDKESSTFQDSGAGAYASTSCS